VHIYVKKAVYICCMNNRHNKEDAKTASYSGDGEGIMKYRNIVEATENFSDDYVILSGTAKELQKFERHWVI